MKLLDVPKLSDVEQDLFIRYCRNPEINPVISRDISTLLLEIQALREEVKALRLMNQLPPFDALIPLPEAQEAVKLLSHGRYRLQAIG